MLPSCFPDQLKEVAYAGVFLCVILTAIHSIQQLKPSPFPLINGIKLGGFSYAGVKKEFVLGARQLVEKGLDLAPRQPFRIIGDVGEIFILPSNYAHEIRNHKGLSFGKAASKWFYGHLAGFEAFREATAGSQIMKFIAEHQLTHQMGSFRESLLDECRSALQDIYTDNKEWHSIVAKEANLQVLARITSRIFLGADICRNPVWLRITTTYAVVVFRAVEELRPWPSWLRPLVQWFMPDCTALRGLVEEARALIRPLLEQRRAEKKAAAERGEKIEFSDAIEWLEQTAQEKKVHYDAACAQLSLSLLALHSTVDFFTQALLDIASHSELIKPLRQEIISVLNENGWSKQSAYKLKLLDSVLKESQRLKPVALATMRRMTITDVKLSDGLVLPKNKFILVSTHKHWDANLYDNPERFDGYRFFKMRQEPGEESKAQLVNSSPEHLGFGYGSNVCPGRFFAVEEIKLVFCHILLKYDFEPVDGSSMEPTEHGLNIGASSTAKLAVRRRLEDIAL